MVAVTTRPGGCQFAIELFHNLVPHQLLESSLIIVTYLPAQWTIHLVELFDVIFVCTQQSQLDIMSTRNVECLGSCPPLFPRYFCDILDECLIYIQVFVASGACTAMTRTGPKRTAVHLSSDLHTFGKQSETTKRRAHICCRNVHNLAFPQVFLVICLTNCYMYIYIYIYIQDFAAVKRAHGHDNQQTEITSCTHLHAHHRAQENIG